MKKFYTINEEDKDLLEKKYINNNLTPAMHAKYDMMLYDVPSKSRAVRLAKASYLGDPTKRDEDNYALPYKMCENIEYFAGNQGLGCWYYFYFNAFAAALFFILGCIST